MAKRREWTKQDVRELKSPARKKSASSKNREVAQTDARAQREKRHPSLACHWIRAGRLEILKSTRPHVTNQKAENK
jgi:hypothetical protein